MYDWANLEEKDNQNMLQIIYDIQSHRKHGCNWNILKEEGMLEFLYQS